MHRKTGNERKVTLDKNAFKRGVDAMLTLKPLVDLLKRIFGK